MKVYNKRTDSNIPIGAVYVGRPSKWGNPYKIGQGLKSGIKSIDRAKAIENYRGWLSCRLTVDPNFLDPLRGKDLVCWCHNWDGIGSNPNYCHADVILELANSPLRADYTGAKQTTCTESSVVWREIWK